MTRRQLRESIFKALFRIEFNDREEQLEQLEFHLQELAERKKSKAFSVEEEDLEYIRQKTMDIFQNLEEIDAIIEEKVEGWNLNRIGKAELAILRLAVYEIRLDENVPPKTAINEAVELTKQYCGEEAKGFINAILGQLAAD